ncbi:MAG TPA: ferritin-like domain-containing protein [Candidatus Dormibacteraeota bacterium]|nr:ferritin-like domain-containing protein [Candidatus Dormibacteraeota bacterium]
MTLPEFSPRLGDRMDLAEKRRLLLRFHWIEMEIMEILSSWSETMVHIPVRAGIGRQMFEQALNVESIAWALRNQRHMGRVGASRAPSDEFVRHCERLHALETPAHRLIGMYGVLLPALVAAERAYLDATDRLADGNAVAALDLCLRHHADQMAWAERMLAMLQAGDAERRAGADVMRAQQLSLVDGGGIDADGAPAWHLPYAGWPEPEEVRAVRAERPTAVGQWHTSGHRYRKNVFDHGVTKLRWDGRFSYAESPRDLESGADPESRDALVFWLHGLFHGECQTVDRMGWLIVDFPDLPWPMRRDMAQQAAEEARHIQIVAQLIEGLGGHLGDHPFIPYFGHLRRDHHHPVAHMIMGNIMGEGAAAAQTNEALRYTSGWGNAWLTHGLEHLSGDETVHVSFGKDWGTRLSQLDPAAYWEEGRSSAHDAAKAVTDAQAAFGMEPDRDALLTRVDREFAALVRDRSAAATR